MSTGGEEPVRVLIVDDHPAVRASLRSFLEACGEIVVAEAGDLRGAVAAALRERPDVVLMDVRLPDGSGVEAARSIRAAGSDARVLMLTVLGDQEAMLAALLAGAAGYIVKQVAPAHLIRWIRAAARGERMLDTGALAEVLPRGRGAGAGADPALSQREERVLRLLAEGRTDPEIAEDLGVEADEVDRLVRGLCSKLGVGGRPPRSGVLRAPRGPRSLGASA
ncbi:MAG TPA: response regulator transcription factor [Actinomycetota bacterium]|nr:response regulator transcription factor [Actinomycetota bacterium]